MAALPEFTKPPITEVVSSITFNKLSSFLSPHVGQLWERYRSDFPDCRDLPPLAVVIESPDPAGLRSFEYSDVPPLPRSWFISRDQTNLIQFQQDRFLFNWKRVRDDSVYPRYSTVKSKFDDLFQEFLGFLSETNTGSVDPIQYELTYVNHILFEDGLQTNADIGEVFKDFCWDSSSERFLSPPEVLDWRSKISVPELPGRLHYSMRSATRNIDKKNLVVFELIVRGMANDKTDESKDKWL